MPVDTHKDLDLTYIAAKGEELRARLFPTPTKRPSALLRHTAKRYVEVVESTAPGSPQASDAFTNLKKDLELVPATTIVPSQGIDYEPGNGTCYPLVFTRERSIQQIDDPDRDPPEGMVLVACRSDTAPWAYPFDLSFGVAHQASYVASKAGLGLPDATAIAALFLAISGRSLD